MMTRLDLNSLYYLKGYPLTKEEWFSYLTAEQKMIALWNPENW
jgi:hypothetical protein